MLGKKAFVFLVLGMVGCVSMEEGNVRSFEAPREEVWKAMVSVFKSYPLKTIDEKRGYMETERLSADRFWLAPHQKNQDFSGHSSLIRVKLQYKRPRAKVFISKKVYRQKGFISSVKEVPSDSLEEAVLFYRISRELSFQSYLKKHH